MDYEDMSREELLRALREKTEGSDKPGGAADERERMIHRLQVHQIELEMQNRALLDAQRELEQSRNRYSDLYDFAPVAYCTLSAEGTILELNLTAATMFGFPREQVLGLSFATLVRFEHATTLWRHLGRCAATREPVISELRMFVKGELLDLSVVSVPVLDPLDDARSGGTMPTAFRTAFTDVTARKRAELEREQAHLSEQRLRHRLQQLDRAQMEIAATLADGEAQSPAHVAMLVAEYAQELTTAGWARLTLLAAPDQQTPVLPPIERGSRDANLDGTPTMQHEVRYGGRALALLQVGRGRDEPDFLPDERRALAMLAERVSSALEIARLKGVDARERLGLRFLDRLAGQLARSHDIAQVRDGIARLADELLPEFTDCCVVLFKGETGLAVHAVHHLQQDRCQHIEASLADAGEAGLLPWLNARADSAESLSSLQESSDEAAALTTMLGGSGWLLVPLSTRGKSYGLLVFARADDLPYDAKSAAWIGEIAERCASTLDVAVLMHSLREAVTWRENLMAMISHDLKNPLSAITLSVLSMTADPILQERRSASRQIDLIRRSAAHMESMVNDLLAVNLLERDGFELELLPETCAHLLTEVCEQAQPLIEARSLSLVQDLADELPPVLVDHERVLRVFANLIGNAAKFTPKGGEVHVAASQHGEHVVFSVSDTGPGIPEEQRAQLFERYWKGRKGTRGLGLGLYIAKTIVEAHGGRIWAEDAPGGGARFCFELQRSLRTVGSVVSPAPASRSAQRSE